MLRNRRGKEAKSSSEYCHFLVSYHLFAQIMGRRSHPIKIGDYTDK